MKKKIRSTIKKTKKIVKLDQRECSELTKSRKLLSDLETVDPFSAFDPKLSIITDFELFSQFIQKRASVYESISFLIDKITTNQSVSADGTDCYFVLERSNTASEKYLRMLENRIYLHTSTYQKLQFKVKGLFGLVEQYLEELRSDLHQEHYQELLAPNLKELERLVLSPESQPERAKKILEEFSKIRNALDDVLEFEKQDSMNTATNVILEMSLNDRSVAKRSKGILTSSSNAVELRELRDYPNLTKIDSKRLKIEILCQDDKVGELMTRNCDDYTFISFCEQESSFLFTLNHHGLSLFKEGEELYSRQLEEPFNNNILKEVIYSAEAYYIVGGEPLQILKFDVSGQIIGRDPVVWWDRYPLSDIEYSNKVIRGAPDESGIVVNVENGNLVYIEICENGDAGREVLIRNSLVDVKIDCHEPLNDKKVLTVTNTGLVQILQIEPNQLVGYRQTDSFQLALNPERQENYFYLTICPKHWFAGILVRNFGESYMASKLLIFRLKDVRGDDKLSFITGIDLWEKKFQFYFSVCFSAYFGDKLVLCGHSYNGSVAHTYIFDVADGSLTERQSIAFGGNQSCYKLVSNGSEVCGLLAGGSVLKFKFSLQI